MEMARVALDTDPLESIRRAIKGSEQRPGDTSAVFKMLERVRPEQWSPAHKVEHSGPPNIVAQHTDRLVEVLGPLLSDLDLTAAQMAMAPDLIEKYFSLMERRY